MIYQTQRRSFSRHALAAKAPELELVAHCPVDLLGPVEPDPVGRVAAWRDAVADLADALPQLPDLAGIDWRRTATAVLNHPASDLGSDRFGPVLALHMRALADLLQAGAPIQTAAGEPAETVLLRHEQRHWATTTTAHGITLTAPTLRMAVAVATLFGAANRTEALAIVAHLPGTSDLRADDQRRVTDWVATVYPGSYWSALQPDLLGEHLVASVLADQPDVFNQAAGEATHGQWKRALTVLSRAALNHPHLRRYITQLVQAHPGEAVIAAIAVAIEVVNPQPLLEATAKVIDGTDDRELLRRIAAAVPQHTQVHRDTAALVATALVTSHRASEHDEATNLPDLAMWLNNLSVRLGDVGRREEGLAASEEATSVYRELARQRPDAFLPNLAASLNNLSNRLGIWGGAMTPLRLTRRPPTSKPNSTG
jgi:hypothetical protein